MIKSYININQLFTLMVLHLMPSRHHLLEMNLNHCSLKFHHQTALVFLEVPHPCAGGRFVTFLRLLLHHFRRLHGLSAQPQPEVGERPLASLFERRFEGYPPTKFY
jgi:hypothetical protein